MTSKKILALLVLGLTSIIAPADDHKFQNPDSFERLESHSPKSHASNTLSIVSPKIGQTVSGDKVTATIKVGHRIDRGSLLVRLNGKDISSRLRRSRCSIFACEYNAVLTQSIGLRPGANGLRASAKGFDKHIDLVRVRFDYTTGLLGNPPAIQYLPASLGVQLGIGGNAPFVTITTGTPSALNDEIDQTTYSIPYADVSLPKDIDPQCGNEPIYNFPLWLEVLDRKTPVHEIRNVCFPDTATLKDFLTTTGGLTSDDLVMLGTTSPYDAPPGLDTSSIGGIDHTKDSPDVYPHKYMMIGVPGAAPGTAFENYNVNPQGNNPLQYLTRVNGLLVKDENGNYNFQPSDSRLFKVSPNDTNQGTSVVVVGKRTYLPPAGSQNGFWLLQLERIQLQPLDSTSNGGDPCPNDPYDVLTSVCGTFYPTGSSDSATATQAVADLASALINVSPRTLAVLTTIGQPFQNNSVLTANLAQAIVQLGGSRYVLPKLVAQGSTFSLIAPGALTPRAPFDRTLVISSNAYSAQNQTGYVTGVLAQDRTGLYAPLASAQSDGLENGQNAVTLSPDFSFYQIASQQPVDWPLTDSSGHIAAYHWVSQWYLGKMGETGSHSQDVRYFYDTEQDVWTNYTQLDCSTPNTCPAYPANPSPSFTEQEFTDALTDLHSELLGLSESRGYLGVNGLRSVIYGANSYLPTTIISATYNIDKNQFGVTANNPVSVNASNWMNLTAGVLGLVGAPLGVDFAVASATVGVLGGALSTGSAMVPFFEGNAPPSYENTFDTTIGQLSGNAQNYEFNLTLSYDTAMDTVYTDPSKIAAVFAKTSNSDSGWLFTQVQQDAMENIFSAGVSRAIYLQLLPQFYSLDTYSAQPVSEVSKLGMLREVPAEYETFYACTASYPSLSPEAYGVFPQIGNPTSGPDIFVIGGTINNQGKFNVSESLPSQSLLDALFAPATSNPNPYLNFPTDPFYSNTKTMGGLLTYRGGPNQGYGQCYKPGCTYTGNTNKCMGP